MPLSDKPLFLDANILLDWAFTTRSWAQIAVYRTLENKGRLVTSEEALQEAHNTIDAVVPIIANRSSAHDYFQGRLRSLPHNVVSDPHSSEFDTFNSVSGTDQYLLRACLKHDLTLLTSDAPLRLSCPDHGVSAVVPIELLVDIGHDRHSLDGPSYERNRGAVVFCGVLSYFPGANQDLFYEVFRVDDDFVLLVNPGRSIWRLMVRDAQTAELLAVDAEVANLEGSFADRKVGASWSDGKLMLIDFDTEHTGELPIPNGLFVGEGVLHFGPSGHFEKWPSLIIKASTRDNRPIGKKSRRLMRGSPWYVLPHPFDKDRLKLAVRGYLMGLGS